MIKLVENYFRGKKKSVIAEELSAFCEEHGLAKCIFLKGKRK